MSIWRAMRRIGMAALLCAVLLGAGGIGHGAAAPDLTAFYRLRFEFTMTTDWLWLDFGNHDALLAARVIRTDGDLVQREATRWGVYLEQELLAAQNNTSVSVTVDVALCPDFAAEPLRMRLHKGALNAVHLRVLALQGADEQLLGDLRIEEPIAGDGLPIWVGLGALAAAPPQAVAWPRFATPRLVWAYYYNSFTTTIWASTPFVDLPQTRYASSDPEAIARQVEQAQSAGIDGFILAWWGPEDAYGDSNARLLLDVAAARGFRVLLNILHTGARQRTAHELAAAITYAIDRYGSHPAYMRLDDRPVFLSEYSPAVPLEVWEEALTQVRQTGREFYYLAAEHWNREALALFDGLTEKHPITAADDFPYNREIADLVHGYSLLMDDPAPRLWAAAVQPGWDDSAVASEPSITPREAGAFYSRSFSTALYGNPDWLLINSWNDWWAGTQIEPAASYGSLYLDLTARWINWWRARESFDEPREDAGPVAGAWRVELFKDENGNWEFDDGAPLRTDEVQVLNRDWGEEAPPGLPADFWMARATRAFRVEEGHGLLIRGWSNDGLRVWLDRGTPGEQHLIDAWRERNVMGWPDAGYLVPLAPGEHTLTVEFYEQTGLAALRFYADLVP